MTIPPPHSSACEIHVLSYLRAEMALLLKRLELAKEADVAISVHRDTRPLPLSRRTYGPWQFVTLWIVTGSFNVSGW